MTDATLLVVNAATDAQTTWESLWGDGNGPVGKAVNVVVIVLIALLVRLVSHRVVRMVVDRIVTGVKRRRRAEDTQALLASPVSAARVVQRTRTLGSVLNNVVSVIIVIVATLSIITTLNSNLTGAFSLITAALGAGLGFGAQSIVKDVLTGLFMVADDQLGVGDVVDTDHATGMVEEVGIRVTQIRDANGVLWYVRNGEINRVGNHSQGWARAVVDVSVPRSADVDAVQRRMLEVANVVVADPQWHQAVLEQPDLWGLESVTADASVLRIVVKTRSNTRDDVAWALRVAMKGELDRMGVDAASVTSPTLERYEQPGVLRAVHPVPALPTPRRTTRPRTPTAPTFEVPPPGAPGPRSGSGSHAASAGHRAEPPEGYR